MQCGVVLDSHPQAANWVSELLQYMRDLCLSPSILSGGAGCASQLAKLDRFVRNAGGVGGAGTVGDDVPGSAATEAKFRPATAAEARDILMRAEALAAYSGSDKLGMNSDFVRHGDKYRRNYASNRSFAMESVKERLKTLDERLVALRKTIAQRAHLPSLRWQWAAKSVASGLYCPTTSGGLAALSLRQFRRLASRMRLLAEIERLEAEAEAKTAWAGACALAELHALCGPHLRGGTGESARALPRKELTRLVVAPLDRRRQEAQNELRDVDRNLFPKRACAPANGARCWRTGCPGGKQKKDGEPHEHLHPMEKAHGTNSEIRLLIREVKAAEAKVVTLDKHRAVLIKAQARDEDETQRETQDKFSGLNQMAEGFPAPSCSVCLVSACEDPVVTPCAHIYCKTCFLSTMAANQVLDQVDMAPNSVKCPLCRRTCPMGSTIEIIPGKEPGTDDDYEMDEEPRASSAAKGKGKMPVSAQSMTMEPGPLSPSATFVSAAAGSGAGPADENRADASAVGPESTAAAASALPAREAIPTRSSAATQAEYDAVPVPTSANTPAGRIATIPALPRSLLAHLVAATGMRVQAPASAASFRPSSKVTTLLRQLEEIVAQDINYKVVVFTSVKRAIPHLAFVLKEADIEFSRIVRGDSSEEQERALGKFTDEGARVLILHAGAAAAGLTLTMAQHVILMEPFFKRGEELQALNRCHRIGQERPVTCTTYYIKGSFEERLLASRSASFEQKQGDGGFEGDNSKGLSVPRLQAMLGLDQNVDSDESGMVPPEIFNTDDE